MENILECIMIRKETRTRLKDIAKALGITESYICMFESGKVKWSDELVSKYKQFHEKLRIKASQSQIIDIWC